MSRKILERNFFDWSTREIRYSRAWWFYRNTASASPYRWNQNLRRFSNEQKKRERAGCWRQVTEVALLCELSNVQTAPVMHSASL